MKSIINSDPKNPKGWVAAARVEELDGKLAIARQILANAVDQCPTSEDIWYEAARLEKPDKAKEILTKGIISCPKSVKLWLAHAKLEKDAQLKKVNFFLRSLISYSQGCSQQGAEVCPAE